MAKALRDTIFMGQFYPRGSELPKEHEELSKGKTSRLGSNFTKRALEVAASRPAQGGRPGMSGSGKAQVSDIVDIEGHLTALSEKEQKELAKDQEKAEKEQEKAAAAAGKAQEKAGK